jgi:hypothetical protein
MEKITQLPAAVYPHLEKKGQQESLAAESNLRLL